MDLTARFLDFGERSPAASRRQHALADWLREHVPALTDAVPGYERLYLEYDADRLSAAELDALIARGRRESSAAGGREVTIEAEYSGPDLPELAARAGMSAQEAARLHASEPYFVYALGFVAGFPFLGDTPAALRAARRPAPRPRVAAHTLAVAGAQSGVYPVAAPGGWNLIGHTLQAVFDPRREPNFLALPGDTVRFVPTQGPPPPAAAPLGLRPADPAFPALEVLRPGLLTLVVDRGRFRVGHLGLVRGGALDPLAAGVANRLLGNAADAALLELHLDGPILRAVRDVPLAVTGGGLRPLVDGAERPTFQSFFLRAGETLSFAPGPPGRVAYLGLAGGLESALYRGSASEDRRAGLGAPLRAGDVLGQARPAWAAAGRAFRPPLYDRLGDDRLRYDWLAGRRPITLRLLPLDPPDPEVLRALVGPVFTVAGADRMGARLSGPAIPGGEVASEGAPVGAVQVPPGGQPIILLHDKGTLGGYRKPARVHPADLPLLAQAGEGARLRFRLDERFRLHEP